MQLNLRERLWPLVEKVILCSSSKGTRKRPKKIAGVQSGKNRRLYSTSGKSRLGLSGEGRRNEPLSIERKKRPARFEKVIRLQIGRGAIIQGINELDLEGEGGRGNCTFFRGCC